MLRRRDFIRTTILAGSASGLGACMSRQGACGRCFDDNLTVFISDLHVSGTRERYLRNKQGLERTVDEILAMRPLPRHVVCLGDIALTYGLATDYAASKPILTRLVKAEIDLVLTMGNHDRRSEFFKAWPDRRALSPVPGRTVSVVSLGSADLVVLDALKGTDDRGLKDMGPVEGTIDAEQLAWLERFVATAKRPFFVSSHQFRDLYIEGEKPLARIAKSPYAVGWIYGHDHIWAPDMSVASWKDEIILPHLALPSTGHWGDIGYVVFRTDATGATAELVQHDFYFESPRPRAERPAAWDVRVAEARGKKTRFTY